MTVSFAFPHPRACHGWHRCLLAWLLVCSGVVLAAQEAPIPTPAAAVISSFAEFWRQDMREKSRPIRMEMVVAYYDPAWGNLWGRCGDADGYVAGPAGLPIRAHDRVLVEGTVVPQSGLRTESVKFTILERGVAIPVLDAAGRLGEADLFKEKLVTFEAIVDEQRSVEDKHVELRLVAGGNIVRVFHWCDPIVPFPVQQGSVVRVTGLYSPRHDRQNNTVEPDIWVSQSGDLVVLGDLASDPRFEPAISPIGQLSPVYLASPGPVRIAGIVRSYTPGREMIVRDPTGQITVRTLQRLPLQIGDPVEAWGTPLTDGADWLLRDAIVRVPAPAVAAIVQAGKASPTKVLRLTDQILELGSEEAAEGRQVDLTGVISWGAIGQKYVYLRDTSGGVLVHMPPELDPNGYKAGAGVRVTGVTAPGVFAPEVRATGFFSWGTAIIPAATPTTLEQALSGREEGQRVEIRGYVTRVTHDAVWTRLSLSVSAGSFSAVISRDDSLDSMVGSIVFLEGVCRAVANNRRQLTGVEIWVGGWDKLRIEQPAPKDPFAVPLRRIGALRQFSAGGGSYWARVRGVVTHQVAGRFVNVQDGVEGLMLLTEQADALVPGDVIEATGMPGLESQRIVLRETVYRKVGHEAEPVPVDVATARTVDEDLESRLVRISGRLVSTVQENEEIGFSIEGDDTVFSASMITHRPRGAEIATWEPGSEIQLTGVYELVRDERREPRGFRLQLRSPADIHVIKRPSWWTPQRAFAVTGLLGLCIAVGITWVAALRRRVMRQTAQIRHQILKEANLEARHREIIANASDFIFTTDLEGNFTSFNPAGERITGFSMEEAVRLSIRDLIAPEDGATGTALMSLVLAEGDATARFETRFQTKDGGRVWVETSARLILEAGKPAGVLGVVRDIGERKQIEEQLKRARDAAEANTQAKSAFLANMSHEIRTPMNGVIGMSNLLLDTPLRPDQREFAETIRTSAEALLTVLNDILDFSKIEAGKLHVEAVAMDLAATVDDSLGLLAMRAVAKRIELAAYIPLDLPRQVRGDAGRLRQVLLNLIGNAVKFTSEGEVVVTVSRLAETATSLDLRFEVSDTGIGISETEQRTLFQPFMQADNSTTRKFGGTGLGLAISKQIVELMGGEVGVRSTLGKGSTFWFTLQVEKIPALAADEPQPGLVSLQGQRVLAVDDNPTNRRIVRLYTEAWQMRCDTAESGSEALRLATAALAGGDPYKLVLLDYHMPETDGVALAQSIHREAGLGAVPMLLLTSLDRRFTREEQAAAGLSGILTKPIRQSDLQNAILRVLGKDGVSLSIAPVVATSSVQTLPAAGSEFSTLRVLVAEDNVVNQRLIQLQLKKLGITADVASNGREALAALGRKRFDVVLMDCQMPELDGYEATRAIRRSGDFPGLRIVAMTANAMQGDREKCLDAGMDDYLSKPTRIDILRLALERCLEAVAVTAAAKETGS